MKPEDSYVHCPKCDKFYVKCDSNLDSGEVFFLCYSCNFRWKENLEDVNEISYDPYGS